jgi:hypothetical protein
MFSLYNLKSFKTCFWIKACGSGFKKAEVRPKNLWFTAYLSLTTVTCCNCLALPFMHRNRVTASTLYGRTASRRADDITDSWRPTMPCLQSPFRK